MIDGLEIQKRLAKFVKRWTGYAGSEVAEAQTFLNELFECYGSQRRDVAMFEAFTQSAGFMDLHWPGICIIEMKAPSHDVSRARDQVKRYWEESSDDAVEVPAAQWVLLCNFHEFEIWEPGRFPKSARIRFPISELEDRYEALLFLAGQNQTPAFAIATRELTTAAAETAARLYHHLGDRAAGGADELQRFIMQVVWVLFAEDLGLIQGHPLQRTVARLRSDPTRSSAAEISLLFRVLNQKTNANRTDLLAGTRYVNGQLFSQTGDIGLDTEEIQLLAEAAEYDWSKVDPTIFGSLMERVLGEERRSALGAHYTHESDIMKIVGPTIIRPWQTRIDTTKTPQQAVDLLVELCNFVVLDPACGCGNFLYVAYREMRALEYQLKQRILLLAEQTGLSVPPGPLAFVPLTNMLGLEIEPISVLISRVTLWMGHRQMIDRYGEAENPLPLVSLSGIRIADAVFDPWPESDCIIGNPPFMGDRKIRAKIGGPYVERLKKAFGVGVIDYCGYWFRLAHQHLKAGQRAGLVSTNTLRENKHRRATLSYIADHRGVITDAVSDQAWPGEAKVYVSITNWVKEPEVNDLLTYTLNGAEVAGITDQLRPGVRERDPETLSANKKRAFIGCQPSGAGFILTERQAKTLQEAGEGAVVKRYLVTRDLAEQIDAEPSRWIIDFGTMTLEQAMKTPKALAMVRHLVREPRETAEAKRRKSGDKRQSARYWWRFAEARPGMRTALIGKERFIAVTLAGKRFLTNWGSTEWCPSNLVGVIALDDDYSMGIMTSAVHDAWAWGWSSTFKTDLRYTPSSTFMTFPWPSPTSSDRLQIAAAAKDLIEIRHHISVVDQIGFTEIYNRMADGAYDTLRHRHRTLDKAVVKAYGWPTQAAQNSQDLVARLRVLNKQISDGEHAYSPFG